MNPKPLLDLILPHIGSSIPANIVHQVFIQKLLQQFPSYSHKKLARIASGSIGGASAHKTIMFHPEFQPNGSNKECVIVRVK